MQHAHLARLAIKEGQMTAPKKTSPSLEIVFEAALSEIGIAIETINTMLMAHGVSEATRDDVNIVLSEVLTNSVRHGYCLAGGWIACSVTIRDSYLACRVTDAAVPFDPSQQNSVSPDPSVLAEGGYGWPLILALAKSMEYHRAENQNEFRFKIPLTTITSEVA
jgi:serine/threonine-protein kinase RsbW